MSTENNTLRVYQKQDSEILLFDLRSPTQGMLYLINEDNTAYIASGETVSVYDYQIPTIAPTVMGDVFVDGGLGIIKRRQNQYSKLKLYIALAKIGKSAILDNWLDQVNTDLGVKYQKLWDIAVVLEDEDDFFEAAKAATLGSGLVTQAELDEVLAYAKL